MRWGTRGITTEPECGAGGGGQTVGEPGVSKMWRENMGDWIRREHLLQTFFSC